VRASTDRAARGTEQVQHDADDQQDHSSVVRIEMPASQPMSRRTIPKTIMESPRPSLTPPRIDGL
jgi:hypothetical protein